MTLIDQLDWQDDYFRLASYTFRLQHGAEETSADDAFLFYKSRSQVEQFNRFLVETGLQPKRVLELGIWDGGSAAFWVEALQLETYVAIDLQTRGDSSYYKQWLKDRGDGRAHTYWGVDQTDGPALNRVIDEHQLDPLDLVLDDCSHHYEPTLQSFQLLFNRVRIGGYYVIEDWAWALQPSFQDRSHPWGLYPALHPIVHRLVDVHGSRPDIIPSITIYPDFVAVERGPASLGLVDVSRLTAHRRRPWPQIVEKRARRIAGNVRRQVTRISER